MKSMELPADFSVYLRGHLWAPVPMQYTLIFSQFDQKNSQSENGTFVVFKNYSIFFHLNVLSFNLKSSDIKLYDYM